MRIQSWLHSIVQIKKKNPDEQANVDRHSSTITSQIQKIDEKSNPTKSKVSQSEKKQRKCLARVRLKRSNKAFHHIQPRTSTLM